MSIENQAQASKGPFPESTQDVLSSSSDDLWQHVAAELIGDSRVFTGD